MSKEPSNTAMIPRLSLDRTRTGIPIHCNSRVSFTCKSTACDFRLSPQFTRPLLPSRSYGFNGFRGRALDESVGVLYFLLPEFLISLCNLNRRCLLLSFFFICERFVSSQLLFARLAGSRSFSLPLLGFLASSPLARASGGIEIIFKNFLAPKPGKREASRGRR